MNETPVRVVANGGYEKTLEQLVPVADLGRVAEEWPDNSILDLYFDENRPRLEVYADVGSAPGPHGKELHTEIFGEIFYFVAMVPTGFLPDIIRKLRRDIWHPDYVYEVEDLIKSLEHCGESGPSGKP